MENNFRNAVFNGFNREDVMSYITKISAEHKETSEALEKERDRLFDADAANERLQEERNRLAEELEQVRQQLSEEQEARQALEKAAAERDQLQGRVRDLECQAEEYRRMKEQVAQIELDAHKRAEDILAQAEREAADLLQRTEQEAAEIRAQLREKIETVAGEYTSLLSDFDVLRTHISGELRKMDTAVGQLPIAFHRLSSDMENLKGLAK